MVYFLENKDFLKKRTLPGHPTNPSNQSEAEWGGTYQEKQWEP